MHSLLRNGQGTADFFRRPVQLVVELQVLRESRQTKKHRRHDQLSGNQLANGKLAYDHQIPAYTQQRSTCQCVEQQESNRLSECEVKMGFMLLNIRRYVLLCIAACVIQVVCRFKKFVSACHVIQPFCRVVF